MRVRLTSHARERMIERGILEEEVKRTIHGGERADAKLGRTLFRRNFPFAGRRFDREYRTKQVEVVARKEHDAWIVITALAKYF